jgi:hypothetical protein
LSRLTRSRPDLHQKADFAQLDGFPGCASSA